MSAGSRGAEWRKWDLHVHTPSSIVQHYGPDNDETWERYLSELESLSPEISVLGINDYWFLDGYRRVRAAMDEGRLSNIEQIFPVVEFRLEQFGGVGGAWKRVNMHVIFDPDLDVGVIEQQFLTALAPSFHLDPNSTGPTWQGVVTRESIADYGRLLRESAPKEQQHRYGSDLEEGFNNLVVQFEDVKKALRSSYLAGRILTGVGRAEWESIRWDGSVGSKKTVINFANFVFTASQDVSTWPGIVAGLRDANVTHQLLDCSDAHHWSDSQQNERLGRCDTWINASPSFAGLSHALSEFDDRVHVGLEPPVRSRVRRHPHHFIERVSVRGTDPEKHRLFDYEIPLNAGFVAVIGNKGQGKSALLDCIALAGNSSRTQEFAFLNSRRFLSPSNRDAKEYSAELVWVNGASRTANLRASFDPQAPVQVEYLPQAFVERLCAADPRSASEDDFEAELRMILFTHIKEDDRAGAGTFDELLDRKIRGSLDRLEVLRRDLSRSVSEYLSLTRLRAQQPLAEVEARYELKLEEVLAAESDLEQAAEHLQNVEISSAEDGDLEALIETAAELQGLREAAVADAAGLREVAGSIKASQLALESLLERVDILSNDAATLNEEALRLVATLPEELDSADPIVRFAIDRERLNAWNHRATGALRLNAVELAGADQRISDTSTELESINAQIAARDGVRELARQAVIQHRERKQSLIGDASTPDSLGGLEALKKRVQAVPEKLSALVTLVLTKSEEIHRELIGQLDTVADLYEPASTFISGSRAIELAELEFKAELRLVPSLGGLGSQLDARKSQDLGQRIATLPDHVSGEVWTELKVEIESVLDLIGRDRGAVDGEFRDPEVALRSGSTAAEFLNSLLGLRWIEVRFGLTGGGLPLSQLSPGQRGLILALFYLVVDRRETPLLLDQPEENLDNETISSLLVPAIREAAGRRQTIVVTHNANLAVVGDADQIIHCSQDDRVFTVEAGSISDFATARHAVDVLEGTMPSFTKRQSKWEVHPTL